MTDNTIVTGSSTTEPSAPSSAESNAAPAPVPNTAPLKSAPSAAPSAIPFGNAPTPAPAPVSVSSPTGTGPLGREDLTFKFVAGPHEVAVPYQAPDLPPHFVSRAELLAIKRLLLARPTSSL